MHIPDGFLSNSVSIATYTVSLAICGYSIKKCNKEIGEKQIPLLGVTAAFIFAAQMINFPIGGGTSGHFLGAALAAILMGPYAASIIMSLVLIIQCLGFADGGLTALGANIFNMGIMGGFGSYFIFILAKKLLPKTKGGFMAAVGIASYVSIVLASAFCALELAASNTSPLKIVLPAMTGVHLIIAIGEAIITTTVISIVYASRPDLIDDANNKRGSKTMFVTAALAVSIFLAMLISPFASSAPDGLEKVVENIGILQTSEVEGVSLFKSSPIPDYALPGIKNEFTATALAGLIGVIILFFAGYSLTKIISRKKKYKKGDL